MRRSTVVALVLSLIAVVLVSIGTLKRAGDSDYDPAPLVASPIAASLSLSREADVFVGATIFAKVTAARPGQLNRVDLYDTGRLVDSSLVAPGTASVTLSWVVLAPGPHLLEALVTDAQGQQGFTPSKGVVAFKPEGPARGEPQVALRPGETVGSLRTRIQGTDAYVLPPDAAFFSAPTGGPKPAVGSGGTITPAVETTSDGTPADPMAKPAVFTQLPAGLTLAAQWQSWGAKKLSELPADLVLPPQPDAPLDKDSLPADPPPPGPGPAAAIPLDIPKNSGSSITPPALNPVLAPTTPSQPVGGDAPKPAPPPSAPALTTALTSKETCAVTVAVGGTGGAKVIAGLTSASRPVPVQWGSRTGDGEMTLRLPVGKVSVSFYSGDRRSEPLLFDVPLGCYATVQGNAMLMDGLLILPEVGGEVFVYLGVNHNQHVRAPQVDQTTIKAGKAANIAPYLPLVFTSKKTTTLHLEVWRQHDNTATKFAESTITVTNDGTADLIFGQANALTLEMAAGGPIGSETWSTLVTGDTTPETKTLRWKDASHRVGAVVWQVLAAPLSQANTELQPLGLLAAGAEVGTYQGTFPIPARQLDPIADPEYKSLTTSSPPAGPGMPAASQGWKAAPSPGTVSAALQSGTTGPVLAQTITPTTTAGTASLAPAELQQLMDKVAVGRFGRVYIRVLGVGSFNGQLQELGVVSNLVGYDPPTQRVNGGTRFTAEAVRATVPWRPDTSLSSCVRVFQTNWTGDVKADGSWWKNPHLLVGKGEKVYNDAVAASKFYPHEGTYCPGDFGFKDECGFWCQVKQLDDMLAHIWDEFAAIYNNLGSTLGEFLAEHNPICQWAADAVDSVLVESACKAITKIAVEAVVKVLISAIGLPPAVPTSSQLREIAKGKLKELAKAGIDYIGVPCDDLQVKGTAAKALDSVLTDGGFDIPTQQDVDGQKMFSACDAIVELTYDKIEADVRAAMNKSIVQQSGIPWYDNVPGFLMAPEPRAFIPPVTVWASIILDEKTAFAGSFNGFTRLTVDSYSIYFPGGELMMSELSDHVAGDFATLMSASDADLTTATEAFLKVKAGPTPSGSTNGKGRWFGITAITPIVQDKIYYGQRAWLEVNATTEEVTGLPVKAEAKFPI